MNSEIKSQIIGDNITKLSILAGEKAKFKEFVESSLYIVVDGSGSIITNKHAAQKIMELINKKVNGDTSEEALLGNKAAKGFVAELFMALFFRYMNAKQEYKFKNLEENSFKKGFDGYYIIENEEWIAESKSSSVKRHDALINIAEKGLVDMISGNTENDPWYNAMNHCSAIIDRNISLVNKMKNLSEEYCNENYSLLSDHNIISFTTAYRDTSHEEITKAVNSKGFNKVKYICVDNLDISFIFEVVKEMAND